MCGLGAFINIQTHQVSLLVIQQPNADPLDFQSLSDNFCYPLACGFPGFKRPSNEAQERSLMLNGAFSSFFLFGFNFFLFGDVQGINIEVV